MRLSELKYSDPGAYKLLRRILSRGTDAYGNVSEETRAALRKAFRKLGYAGWLSS